VKSCIVVLNYNNARECLAFIERIIDYGAWQKLLLVDNHSTDDSYQVLRKAFEREAKVILLQAEKNRGYASGNNLGLRYGVEQLHADLLFLANPDVFFAEEVVDELLAFYQSQRTEKLGTVAPVMLFPNQKKQNSAWKLPTFADCLLATQVGLDKIASFRQGYGKQQFIQKAIPVEVLPGSFFAISAEALRAVGYLDEGTFLYGEENILSHKLLSQGYTNYLLPDIQYVHQHSTTISSQLKRREMFHIYYQSLLYYVEHTLKVGKGKVLLFRIVASVGLIGRSSREKLRWHR
jgi:Predicted glycosyltransferases